MKDHLILSRRKISCVYGYITFKIIYILIFCCYKIDWDEVFSLGITDLKIILKTLLLVDSTKIIFVMNDFCGSCHWFHF